jgi:hypothetical protein
VAPTPTNKSGSAIDATGSAIDATGSAIDATGSAIDATGSAIDATGWGCGSATASIPQTSQYPSRICPRHPVV